MFWQRLLYETSSIYLYYQVQLDYTHKLITFTGD